MIYVVSGDGLQSVLVKAAHNDRIHVLGEDGIILNTYRVEQIWGTSAIALLRDKCECERGFAAWIESLPEVEL